MVEDRRIRILIVDDEPFIGDLLERYLTPDGYNCRVVRNGKEAIEELESTSYPSRLGGHHDAGNVRYRSSHRSSSRYTRMWQ